MSARMLLIVVLVGLVAAAHLRADPGQDAFIAGYASAVLERELGVTNAHITVNNGVLSVFITDLSAARKPRIVEILRGIRGVRAVEVSGSEHSHGPAPAAPAVTTAPSGAPGSAIAAPAFGPTASIPAADVQIHSGVQILPLAAPLFDPLLADPRWPHMSTSFQRYVGGNWQNVWSATLGESVPLVQGPMPADVGGQWEVGVQGAAFAFFDLDAPSTDLQNTDYFVAGMFTWRKGDFALLGRVLHQSSHLGDEFLLAHPGVTRVNLSYEEANFLASYNLNAVFRVYGGMGGLFDTDPADLGKLALEYGVEARAPWTFWNGRLRPVAAVDVKQWSETNMSPDLSLRAGVEVEGAALWGRNLYLLLEYFNGHSPNGQFYPQSIQYVGAGVHFFY